MITASIYQTHVKLYCTDKLISMLYYTGNLSINKEDKQLVIQCLEFKLYVDKYIDNR